MLEPMDSTFNPYAPHKAEDEDLLHFCEELAADASLAQTACNQNAAPSLLDAAGSDGNNSAASQHLFSNRSAGDIGLHPLLPPRFVRTPEQILQQLFQQSSRPHNLLPGQHLPACRAPPLYSQPRLAHHEPQGMPILRSDILSPHNSTSSALPHHEGAHLSAPTLAV